MDGCGKTCLLKQHTVGVDKEELIWSTPFIDMHRIDSFSAADFIIMEISGHKRYRDMWADFYYEIDTIVYILDISESSKRKAKAMGLLEGIVTNSCIKNKPKFFLSIVLSKCDLSIDNENNIKEIEDEVI